MIDRTAEDFTQERQTYDVVFDAVGKSSLGRCRQLLKPRGVYLSTDLGPWGQNPLLALVTPLLPGKSALLGFPRHDQKMMNYFQDLMQSGLFRPVIDRSATGWRRSSSVPVCRDRAEDRNVVITVEHKG